MGHRRARVAIGPGVTADSYAGGVKHHWDHVAAGVNAMATTEEGRKP